MKPHLQRLATAGNTGALMLLMFVLVNAPVLCGGDLPAEAPASAWSEAWQSAPPHGNGAAGPLRGGRWAASG